MNRGHWEIIDPLHFPGWDDLILAFENYSFFHSSAWARVLCESYGYRPSYFAMSRSGRFSLVVPLLEVDSFFTGRRAVSLPFSDCCEPVGCGFSPRLAAVPQELIDTAKSAGWKYVDFRGPGDFSPHLPVLSRFLCHSLALSGEKELFRRLHQNTVRNIRRANACGVRAGVFNSLDGMREYYRLHCLTRKRQAAPPQPFSFFRKVYEHICAKGKGLIILAHYGGQAVAGAVFFHFGRKAMYKYGASDMAYGRLGANAAILWEAIKHYGNAGYTGFCFGRTDPDNQGLRRFKLGFGPKEHLLAYHRFEIGSNAFVEGAARWDRYFGGLIGRIPISGLKALGLTYRHFG